VTRPSDEGGEALGPMIRSAEAVQAYTKGGKRRFLASPQQQDAVARRLEILGEAARRLPPAFRDAHPAVPWRSIIGLRDFLLHADDSVDLDKVWSAAGLAVNEVLPALRRLRDAPWPDGP